MTFLQISWIIYWLVLCSLFKTFVTIYCFFFLSSGLRWAACVRAIVFAPHSARSSPLTYHREALHLRQYERNSRNGSSSDSENHEPADALSAQDWCIFFLILFVFLFIPREVLESEVCEVALWWCTYEAYRERFFFFSREERFSNSYEFRDCVRFVFNRANTRGATNSPRSRVLAVGRLIGGLYLFFHVFPCRDHWNVRTILQLRRNTLVAL